MNGAGQGEGGLPQWLHLFGRTKKTLNSLSHFLHDVSLALALAFAPAPVPVPFAPGGFAEVGVGCAGSGPLRSGRPLPDGEDMMCTALVLRPGFEDGRHWARWWLRRKERKEREREEREENKRRE